MDSMRPAIGNTALNALGNELGEAILIGALALDDTFAFGISIGEIA